MDFAQALNELWRLRRWVALGVLASVLVSLAVAYDVGLIPPRLDPKTLPIARASTSILVDTPQSAITDLNADLGPLADRAIVFGRLGVSQVVRRDIARRVGLEEDEISFLAPLEVSTGDQSTADARITSILAADDRFQVAFLVERGLPSIRVQTEAPELEDALRLATESSDALVDYIADVQRREGRPVSRRVVLRPLSEPQGAVIAAEINRQLMGLAFVATFLAWCLGVLAVAGVRTNLRRIREEEDELLLVPDPTAARRPAERERVG